VTFGAPAWLLLAIPLALALVAWRPPTRTVAVLRIALFVTIVLALARLAIVLPSREGEVVVVADRSASMPADGDRREREIIHDLDAARGRQSRLAVVSFGARANVEATGENDRFSAFQGESSANASNLHDGLESALAVIPPGASGRVVVVSDGRWSGRDPSSVALTAAERGIAIDYALVARAAAGDTAIESVDAPATVSAGEAFVIAATIRAPIAQDATITLRRGNDVVSSGAQRLTSGANRLSFRDRAGRGGVQSYTLEVSAAGRDPRPENNRARFLVAVQGAKPVLIVSGSPASHFASLLKGGGIAVDVVAQSDLSLERLSNYSAVVLENVATQMLGSGGMETLAEWVRSGGALMITGGQSSFAAGGYFHSPLDPVLPVSMQMRREHRKLDLSIVVAMDRSGSMGVSVGGSRTKMDLADLAAAQVLDLLGPTDELGVVAVDSSSHIIADLDKIGGRDDLRSRILSVDSAGGGIFIYEALATSAKMMLTAKSQTRHIILFADANDSEEPGDYKALLQQCAHANITVSVVGLGTPHDSDAGLLRDIAARGGGRCYFTEDAAELPRLFAQDTFIVARSAFVRDPTAIHPTPALLSMTGRNFGAMPAIGGYNLCYVREGATPSVMTDDEYHAPVVAAWQVGLGRVLAYTGEIDGDYTGAIAKWSDVGTFQASLVRWVAGASSSLPDDMLVRQHIENGAAHIELQLDPERATNPITRAPRVITLSAAPGAKTTRATADMEWVNPDLLALDVPVDGAATSLSTVAIDGGGSVILPPVVLPYSPEYAPADETAGRAELERLARVTGGRERLALADVWRDLPKRSRELPLRPWFAALAMLLLLAETLERRTGISSSFAIERLPRLPKRQRRVRTNIAVATPSPKTETAAPSEAPPVKEIEDELVIALRKAGDRARRRT
jgi:uncharacterized membrane protein